MRRFQIGPIVIVVLAILAFSLITVPVQAQVESNTVPIVCWIGDNLLAVIHQHQVVYFVTVVGDYLLPLHLVVPSGLLKTMVATCDPTDPLYTEPGQNLDTQASPNGRYVAYFEMYQDSNATAFYLVVLDAADPDNPVQISPDFQPG